MAAILAAGIGVMGVFAQGLPPVGVCGSGPGEINCFDPAAQGEMWRALEPIGARIQPNVDGAGIPEFADPLDSDDGVAVNEAGDEIWVSTAADLATAFSQLSPGECTFAHLGDDLGLTRQCKALDGSMVPPPEGKLFYPSGLAVDGTTVYVSDRMNHRVSTMHFEGDAFSLAHPIGNGEPGTDSYAYTEGAATGLTGSRLNAPNGLAVDAASHLLVADGGNARIAIFNADGSNAFAWHFTVPAHPLVGDTIVPTLVAVSPGAVVVAPGTPPANVDDRIVVVDRYKCTAWIMDAGFNPIGTLPAQLPQNAEPGTACVSGAFGYPSAVGEFSILTGATIDAAGHIYLVDSWNNRIVIFDRNGVLLGAIGEPPVLAPGEEPPVEALATPSSILIDHLGRLVVNDSDNLRVAFYIMDFPADGPPTAAFQFEVPAPGDDIEGFPTALAEQWGFGPGLDPAGRYLKVDTANNRVQRVELADLAIVLAQAQASTPLTGTGSFAVAVPSEKIADVDQVTVTVEAEEPGVVVTSINALPPAMQTPGDTEADPNDIPRGSWVKYEFTYTNPTPNQSVTFKINAAGNKLTPLDTTADEVIVVVRGVCVGCEAEHAVYDYPAPAAGDPVAAISETTDTGDWYNRRVFVRLSPVDDNPSITSIEWYVRGSDMPSYGSGIHVSPLSDEVRYVDVPLYGPETEITYWPVTVDDTVGPKVTAVIGIDMSAPAMTFGGWPLPAGVNDDLLSEEFGTEWYTDDVTANTVVRDGQAGVDLGDGTPKEFTATVTVTGDGRGLFATPSATDLVDNRDEYHTDDPALGGKVINIDRTPPVVIAPHIEVVQTAGGFGVIGPGVFVAEASDDLSGIAEIINPNVDGVEFPLGVSTRDFTARNHAGLVTTVQGTVTVIARERSSIAAIGGSVVYGGTITLIASVLPATATGDVTFTFGGATFTDDSIVDGIASVEIPVVMVDIGTYTMDVTYSGDAAVAEAATTATVIVTAAAITVRADAEEKPYGGPDPDLAYHVTVGALVGDDQFEGELTRAAGENVGVYAITQGTLRLSQNYVFTVAPGTFRIDPRALTVTATSLTKYVAAVDPALTYSITSGGPLVAGDAFTGALVRDGGEAAGTYAIRQGTLTAGPNYAINFVEGTLTVQPVPVNLPPTALPDAATAEGAAPVTIHVLGNDSDLDGGTLSLTGVTQPVTGGGVTTSGNLVIFTPTPGFVGVATFTYTVGDGQGGSATATVTVTITAPTTCTITGFTTFTQGGWGATPKGNNPAMLLQSNFELVYPAGLVRIGGAKLLTFTSSTAIRNFLPAGGTASVLTVNATNPTTSSAGVFAGQVLALRLNVDFSRAGITKPGLENLLYQGYSVGQILDAANRALGGDTAILAEMGLTLSQLNGIVDKLNRNFDNGSINLGYLACPGTNRRPDAVNDGLATTKNTARTISVIANDSDPDGDSLTVTAVTQPAKGSVIKNANGTVKYTPPSNWTGTTSFTYTVSDGKGGTDTATVTVTVGSHTDGDGCGDDHDHDGDHDGDDDRERDCDRDHRHTGDCDRDRDRDNDGWYRDRDSDDHDHNRTGVCSNSSHYGNWKR